jgi:hypothetical protein
VTPDQAYFAPLPFAWQPNPGGGSTYRGGKSVQTTGTTSPGYAPELNPDELVWNYMKRTGTAKHPLTRGQSLKDRIEADLLHIQNNPALVRSFFQAPDVVHITDG